MEAEVTEQQVSPDTEETFENRKLYHLRLDSLETDPAQPRKRFDEVAIGELTDSIREHGVLQPVLFREGEEGQLVVVSGERRFRACKEAGEEKIPAIYIEGGRSAEIALVENLLRENLTPIEEAEALQRLKEEEGYTGGQLSKVIGKAESTISEILSLNNLPESVKDDCRESHDFSRRRLVEIAKAGTPENMEKLFERLKKQELDRDAVRQASREKPSPAEALKKKAEGFLKQLQKADFEEFGDQREDVENALRELAEAIQEKLPTAE